MSDIWQSSNTGPDIVFTIMCIYLWFSGQKYWNTNFKIWFLFLFPELFHWERTGKLGIILGLWGHIVLSRLWWPLWLQCPLVLRNSEVMFSGLARGWCAGLCFPSYQIAVEIILPSLIITMLGKIKQSLYYPFKIMFKNARLNKRFLFLLLSEIKK